MKTCGLYIVLVALIFLMFGCSGTQQLTQESNAPVEKQRGSGIINEYFDPLILEEDDLVIKKTISTESRSDNMEAVMSEPTMTGEQPDQLAGFRVQICAVSEEEKARQIQREAILRFTEEEVYLIYDNPYYKVRVGDCLTRYDADRLQQYAVEKGFTDAWVVKTKIKPNPQKEAPQNPDLNAPK